MENKLRIDPNKSFNEAIDIAFKQSSVDCSNSYQILSIEKFMLKKGRTTETIIMTKIRVCFSKNKWIICEFNMVREGDKVPKKFRGDYELLTSFECFIY